LVHQLKPDSECVNVEIRFENDQLIIQRDDTSTILFRVRFLFWSHDSFEICFIIDKRPSYCPFTNLHFQNNSSIIPDNPLNSIAVGVVILFECHDHCVLLTRRASHMRTFPSCWVCPGGGIEKNETVNLSFLFS